MISLLIVEIFPFFGSYLGGRLEAQIVFCEKLHQKEAIGIIAHTILEFHKHPILHVFKAKWISFFQVTQSWKDQR